LQCLDSSERAIPSELAGKPIEACIDAIAEAFRENASPRFVADLDDFRDLVSRLGGSTYSDFLAGVGRSRPENKAMAGSSARRPVLTEPADSVTE
ncbi:MAG TPA: hypothetical protein VFZ51_09285, partial [Woeseiaceae bacterium]